MQRVPSCGYCFKPYAFKGSGRPVGQRIPRLLSCGHTFCDGCVSKLAELHPGELACPTCDQRMPLPHGKRQLKDLPTNLYILGILINNVRALLEKDVTKGELSNIHLEEGFNFKFPNESYLACTDHDHATAEHGSEDEILQLICDECCETPAACECLKCTALYCKPCFTVVHSSSRTLRTHEETPIDLKAKQISAENVCPTHPEKEIEFYDKTDETLICSLCVVLPQYKEHEVVPISELCDGYKEQIEKGIEEVVRVNKRLKQSRGQLSFLYPAIKAECSQEVQQIKEHFQDLHTKLQAREFILIQEVKAAYSNEDCFDMKTTAIEIMEKAKELESLISQSTAALRSPAVMVKDGDILVSRLSEAKDMPCALLQSSLQNSIMVTYPPEFEQDLKSYGSVVLGNSGLQLKKLSEEPQVVSAEVVETADSMPEASSEILEESSAVTETVLSPVSGRNLMNLPLRQNLVYVTHIKNPCDFRVQYAADTERLENLMDAINRYCHGAKGLNDMVKSTEIGDMVCAQYSKDHYWYRARVISDQQPPSTSERFSQQGPKVEVCFIDYGNTEVLLITRLRKIKPEFTDIPELAANCSLVDIMPPTLNETWPSQSVKAFGSLTREKGLLMSVMRKSPGKLFVDLKSPEEEPTRDDDKPASVRDALVFLDVARFTSPASDPNAKVPIVLRSFKKPATIQESETLEVVVGYAENPSEVYVIVNGEKEYADTMKIVNQMSSMYAANKGNQWRITWPYKGLVCAARFSGDKVWYRALVTQVIDDQHVHVTYVDFGNSEVLPFTEIRRIPDHMLQLPMQAIQCSLTSIKPIHPEGWSAECKTFLSETCDFQKFRMKVVVEVEKGRPLSVILYQVDVPQPTSVNHLLVLNNHADLIDSSDLEILKSEPVDLFSDDLFSVGEVNLHEIRDWSLCEENSKVDTPEEYKVDAPVVDKPPKTKQLLKFKPGNLKYKPVEYPTTTKFQLAVTFVDEDCTIYGYQTEKSDQSLPELMKLLQTVCSSGEKARPVTEDQLLLNQPCCAEFSEDSLWYRAEIVGLPVNSTVLVDYVDFGNREVIPLTSIKLDAAFLDIPKQCVPLKLEGLPQIPDVQTTVSKILTQLLIGQTCMAIIEKQSLLRDMLQCIHLTLPDGSDVLDVAKQIMSEGNTIPSVSKAPTGTKSPRKSPKKGKQKAERAPIPISVEPIITIPLIEETYLPEKGVAFDVTVTQVDSPSVVYLQRIPPTADDPGYADSNDPSIHITKDHLNQLLYLSDIINTPDYFDGIPAVTNVWVGMLCCACYSQDAMWYRAQITELLDNVSEPPEVKVLYFDYGTNEVISTDKLKSFPGELLSLPKQAARCAIVDVDDDQYNVDNVINAVVGKKLICKVLEFGSPVKVQLYERVFNEDDDSSYEDVAFSQRLAELELAQEIENSDSEEDDEESSGDEDREGSSGDDEVEESSAAEDEDHNALMSDGDEKAMKQDEKQCQQEIQIVAGQNMLASPRRQLITPAQFYLKNDATKSSPETESGSSASDHGDEVD